MFDSHAHYFDSRFENELEGGAEVLLPQLFSDDVEYIINVGTNNENNPKCLEMAQKYEGMYAAVGIHPEDCRDYGREELDRFNDFLNEHRDFKKEKIVAIGSPLGLLNTVSTGVFSGYNDTGEMKEIQFSASISQGSSGGALFNNAGEVIGITTASYTEGQNLNVAVPIQYAVDMKNAQSTEMTIAQFYETFDHYNEYTVSDLLRNRDLKEDLAYVYGIVAKIEEISFNKKRKA